ncbi:MAG TPA: tetratricopeptide repeat protein [Xanthobacteraceae bacterium]|jgi:tetratricopeptide (TPR) repeat protein
MTEVSKPGSLVSRTGEDVELRRLLPVTSKAAEPHSTSCHDEVPTGPRILQLDAHFESGGAWAGVDQLTELAYLGLLEIGEDAIVEEHLLELHMVLLKYRDRIRPKYLCLTDTATTAEKTRFYPADRAYRLVHGLIGMVLQWKRALLDRSRWVVIVRNFDHAQHLATRFFGELARRSAAEGEIDVIVETRQHDWSDIALRLPGMQAVPAAPWITELKSDPAAPDDLSDVEIQTLEMQVEDSIDSLLDQQYHILFTYYRSSGDDLAAARVSLKLFIIYNSYGYYHEAKHFLASILPYFDQLVGTDEAQRIYCVSRMNICLVMINDPVGALRIVEELADSYLTRPRLLADMNYILGMHYLRYAEAKDIGRAEQHILRAVGLIRAANDDPESGQNPFQKVFIDNGLAFLRARQGRHQEALDLCQSGYEFLTKALGEDRHRLHRSVLQYNIAQVYVMLGELDKGLEYYRKAIGMDPYYSEYHNEVGNILQDQRRYQEANESYMQAIWYSAPYPEVYFNKAVCHARQDELQDALTCFQISLELKPNQPECHALRADVLREIGRVDEALEGYNTAIALGYDSTAVRVNRAVLHYNNGSYELALSDMDHVIAGDAQEAAHYENRAAIYEAMNREDLYLCDLRTAQRCREAA